MSEHDEEEIVIEDDVKIEKIEKSAPDAGWDDQISSQTQHEDTTTFRGW